MRRSTHAPSPGSVEVMANVCAGPEFSLSTIGELTLAPAGVHRRVARVYMDAVFDGAYGATPSPGRTHVDLEASWVNDTSIKQWAMVEAERGPWLIIVANTNEAYFRDRLTTASGPSARAVEPDTSSAYDSEFCGHLYAPAQPFLPPTVPEIKATTYTAQDRGRTGPRIHVLEPGDTISARYRVTFHTKAPFRTVLGREDYEARARYGIVRIYAAPARGV